MSPRIRATVGLVLAMLAMWLAAPAADWRAVPWGVSGVEQDFALAVAELLAALVIAAWAIGRLPTAAPRDFFVVFAAAFAGFLVLETLYWRLPGVVFQNFARQWDGVKAAPIAVLLAIPFLLRLPAANLWSRRTHIATSRWTIGAGAVAAFALMLLPPSGMLDAIAFSLLATALATGGAVSLSALAKPHDPPSNS